jgi:hypothetical protein
MLLLPASKSRVDLAYNTLEEISARLLPVPLSGANRFTNAAASSLRTVISNGCSLKALPTASPSSIPSCSLLLVYGTLAPELNHDEGVWSLAKRELANSCPDHVDELMEDIIRSINGIRRSPKKLCGCTVQSDLPIFLR